MESFFFYSAILCVTGVTVGFLSGLLGVGGAFLMVPVQFWVLTSMGFAPDIAIRTSFGTGLLVLVPTAMSGAYAHHRLGEVVWKAAVILGIIGGAGAFIGAFTASQLSAKHLTVCFGIVVILLAIRMSTAGLVETGKQRVESVGLYLLWGLPFGFLAGLIGVGGGGIMTVVMVLFLGFTIHEAVGTSSAMMIFTAIGGALSYLINGLGVANLPPYSTGYLNWLQCLLLASGVPMAVVGARVAHALPARKLRFLLILVMFYVGIKMLLIL